MEHRELSLVNRAVLTVMRDNGIDVVPSGIIDAEHDLAILPGVSVGSQIIGGLRTLSTAHFISSDGTVERM